MHPYSLSATSDDSNEQKSVIDLEKLKFVQAEGKKEKKELEKEERDSQEGKKNVGFDMNHVEKVKDENGKNVEVGTKENEYSESVNDSKKFERQCSNGFINVNRKSIFTLSQEEQEEMEKKIERLKVARGANDSANASVIIKKHNRYGFYVDASDVDLFRARYLDNYLCFIKDY